MYTIEQGMILTGHNLYALGDGVNISLQEINSKVTKNANLLCRGLPLEDGVKVTFLECLLDQPRKGHKGYTMRLG